jgi:hypothetical protein
VCPSLRCLLSPFIVVRGQCCPCEHTSGHYPHIQLADCSDNPWFSQLRRSESAPNIQNNIRQDMYPCTTSTYGRRLPPSCTSSLLHTTEWLSSNYWQPSREGMTFGYHWSGNWTLQWTRPVNVSIVQVSKQVVFNTLLWVYEQCIHMLWIKLNGKEKM